MGSKGPGTSIGPNREAMGDLADEATSVIELSGVIKWFDVSKGFGFIVDQETKESIFVHANGLVDQIKENSRVSFEVEMGQKGPNAVGVKLVK